MAMQPIRDFRPLHHAILHGQGADRQVCPRLILGISDEPSSAGNIERIKLVRDYVDSYNASLEE